jgi:hypothetical protein
LKPDVTGALVHSVFPVSGRPSPVTFSSMDLDLDRQDSGNCYPETEKIVLYAKSASIYYFAMNSRSPKKEKCKIKVVTDKHKFEGKEYRFALWVEHIRLAYSRPFAF